MQWSIGSRNDLGWPFPSLYTRSPVDRLTQEGHRFRHIVLLPYLSDFTFNISCALSMSEEAIHCATRSLEDATN